MCLAVPGKIMEITNSDDPIQISAKVSFGGACKQISLAYVPEARVGEYVIVHAGFALSLLDENEAQKVFDELQAIQSLVDAQDQATD